MEMGDNRSDFGELRIPRYIITLHELLAHTPHNHVERRSLDEARKQLEQLSRQMHDEVSETENIRKNLAIERMIVEGCDILLDVNQVFVRQGSLVHILPEKQQRKAPKIRRGPLDGFTRKSDRDKELIRQCFLFSNHLILATRTSNGHLHLINGIGRVSLADAILIEDPSENDDDLGEGRLGSRQSPRVSPEAVPPPARGAQEKAAWVSDIAQCLDNVQFNNWFRSSVSDTSSVTMPHSIRNDPKLFRDDIDIRFSKTLNSCKVPQVRYATPERLLERLTDLRFLSIDFLNTFLLTYRVFTDGVTVLNALKTVYFSAEKGDSDDPTSPPGEARRRESALSTTLRIGQGESSRRISTASTVSCVSACSEGNVFESPLRGQHWRWTHRR
ncbi:ras-specific guanine nucleotide-releasing factor 2-like, partial [Pollicipes pollicipes]|uniref:ras-specific guanine nucleotide-releasing factor 2-like n=1 Tax=Pollicipes pollicipes TaxID=41117 RepID=UPI00188589C1